MGKLVLHDFENHYFLIPLVQICATHPEDAFLLRVLMK